MTRTVGLDIGGTKCAVVSVDDNGRPRLAQRIPTGAPAPTLAALLDAVAALKPGPAPLFGISCGDPLDSERGVIQSPPNLPGWDDIAITHLLTERFGGRAYLMNDANAGALAEWTFGAGRGCRNMIFLTAGTGMGAGLILNGQLYEGACGAAGEVGHVRLAEDGPEGYGKKGSFEGFCSGGGIARLALRRLAAEPRDTPLKHVAPANFSARDVAAAASKGDPVALSILEEAGRYLGRGLAVLLDILNPDAIVIGNVYARCRSFLEPAMRRELERESLHRALACCRISPAELGEEIGNYAAVAVAQYRAGTTTTRLRGMF